MSTSTLPVLTPALSIEQARINHNEIDTALNSWPEETRKAVPSRTECPDAARRAEIMQANLPLAIRVTEAQQERQASDAKLKQRRDDEQRRLQAEMYWQTMPESERQEWRDKGVFSARELVLDPDQVKAFETAKQAKIEREEYSSFL